MPPFRTFIPLFAAIFFLTDCKTIYRPVSMLYQEYAVTGHQSADNEMNWMLKQYIDNVNTGMNDMIAISGMSLEKGQPAGAPGNVLADAMISIGKEKYHTRVDASLNNFGGVRLSANNAGNITRGKIFGISPFDNIVVLQNVNGLVLQHLLDFVAAKGGLPNTGISFWIKSKKEDSMVINGTVMKGSPAYSFALLDYIANGGDEC